MYKRLINFIEKTKYYQNINMGLDKTDQQNF